MYFLKKFLNYRVLLQLILETSSWLWHLQARRPSWPGGQSAKAQSESEEDEEQTKQEDAENLL